MKILIVEDDAPLRQMLKVLVSRKGFEVVEAEDGVQAWESLRQEHIQLVLTDWMMPNMDGIELIRRIRSADFPEPTYIIMLTAKGLARDVVDALETGADDYIVKPVNPKELVARVNLGERVLASDRALRDARHRLSVFTTHDELTGLLTRKHFIDRARAELNRAQREELAMSLVMLAVDSLDGLEQDDPPLAAQTLRLVAHSLSESVRSYDQVGRWEGNVFTILLPHATHDRATRTAIRLQEQIAEIDLMLPNNPWFPLRSRYGVAETSPANPLALEQLVEEAHQALHLVTS